MFLQACKLKLGGRMGPDPDWLKTLPSPGPCRAQEQLSPWLVPK